MTATRTPVLVRDAPLRVEAVPAEEIEENLTVRPGDVTSLLSELPGVQFQANAPALGGAGLQLRGLSGRHTLTLLDGLPLLGAEAGSFGLLQVPPLDLSRVEVLKGPMSALYGAEGLGGVLNLVSTRPDAESAFLVGGNSRGARDAVAFLARSVEKSLASTSSIAGAVSAPPAQSSAASRWSGTLTAGLHGQSRQDVDGDGWADLPAYRRYTFRPRAWFDAGEGRELFFTVGASAEQRDGGTLPGRALPTGTPFPESLRTERYDAGATSAWALDGGRSLGGRYALTRTHALRTFGAHRASSTLTSGVLEQTLSGTTGTHRWLAGAAVDWNELDSGGLPDLGYSYLTPGAFVQDHWTPAPWLVVGGNLRVDADECYGTYVSPRVGVLLRPADDWNVRLSAATGFATPTPFVEAVESTWLGALLPPHDLHAERARSVSVDAHWADDGLELNASAFVTGIRGALDARPVGSDRLELYNRPGRWRAPGAELLAGYVAGPLHLIASWSALEATVDDGAGERRPVDRTPRRTATVGAILESERRGRIGVEAEYTGPQAVDDDPRITRAPGYTLVNALAEWRFGEVSVYVNALNLTDVRQTRRVPLLRPVPGPGGDPITTAWGPLDGRTIGVGVRGEL